MFNKDNYVIYETKDDRVLLYNKYTKKMTALSNEKYQLLLKYHNGSVTPDRATVDFWNANGLLSESSVGESNRGKKSFFALDKKLHSNSFFKMLEFVLVYFSFPIWAVMFFLHRDHIFFFISHLEIKDAIYIPFVFVLFIIGLLVHEFSHMIVAINNGAYVPELVIGVKHHVVFYGYTRIIGIENIIKKNKIKIYYAGMAMNFLCSALSLILYSFLSSDLCIVAALIFMFQAFANSSVFNNGDGYDMLFSIFDNIGLPRKFGPQFLRENIVSKRWIVLFPIMNMFGTIMVPIALIILRLNNYSGVIISSDVYCICAVLSVILCLIISLCKVNKNTLFVMISLVSMLLTFLTLAVHVDKILLYTVVLVVTIFFIPTLESVFHLMLSVCTCMVRSIAVKKK